MVFYKNEREERKQRISVFPIHSIFGSPNAKRKPLIHLFNDLTGIGKVAMHLETLSTAFAQCVCMPGFRFSTWILDGIKHTPRLVKFSMSKNSSATKSTHFSQMEFRKIPCWPFRHSENANKLFYYNKSIQRIADFPGIVLKCFHIRSTLDRINLVDNDGVNT